MNNVSLPNHVSVTLTDSRLTILLKYLQNILKSQAWAKVCLISSNDSLSFQLSQAWQKASAMLELKDFQSLNLLGEIVQSNLDLEVVSSGLAIPVSELPPVVGSSSEKSREAKEIKNGNLLQNKLEDCSASLELTTILLPDCYTGLLIVSPELNLLLYGDCFNSQASIWQVTLSFEPQSIAHYLQIPAIAASVPLTAQLTPANLTSQPTIMQHLWLQIWQLIQPKVDSGCEMASELLKNQQVTNLARTLPISSHRVAKVQPLLSTSAVDPSWQRAPIGILHESLDGGILRANSAFCRLIGYSEKQLHRLDRRAIAHPEDFAIEMKAIQQIVEGQVSQHTLRKRFLCQNGSVIWTEVSLSLVGDPDAEDSYLLTFVTDLSDRQRAEQEVQQRRDREVLLSDISATIRTTLDVKEILQIAVRRLRQALCTDRVLAYQVLPDQSGTCIAEDVEPIYPAMLGQSFPADCIPPPYLEAYRLGRMWTVANVEQSELAECHHEMLRRVDVRSMIAVAIQRADEALEPQKRTLWGLLVVHHCHAPRDWMPDEQQLVQAIANQIAIAIEQANLLEQLQTYAQGLEDRVRQRTQSLERSLQYEQLVRRLTETICKAHHADEVLQLGVEGLVNVLALKGGVASLMSSEANSLLTRYEYWQGDRLSFKLEPQADEAADIDQKLIAGESITQEHTIETEIYSYLISPILDDQGLLGTLTVVHQGRCSWEAMEVSLVEQVASQCAIALRQAHLYRQEHQQRVSADYFRLFLEKSVDVFVEYDRELRYISINPTGQLMLGRSPAQIIGRTNRELCGAQGEGVERLIQQAFQTNEPVFVDHEVALPTGTRLFETIYTPIAGSDGEVERVIGVCRDITDFRYQWQLLETQNHQLAETSRLKEEFIANTSHELRTPLTAILGFSNVLLQEFFGALNDKQKDYLERIHSSGQHLLDLINDILDLSRLEADRLELEPQHIFITDICESVLSLIQERIENQDLRLEVEVEPDLEDMVVDPRRLKQMLLNLLTNAVKFTPSGAVGLKIYRASSGKSPGIIDRINFMVWDTGIGIAKADQARLFSPFSQIDSSLSRQHSGTGLGLAITRKLAELHGGTITLDSDKGGGSRFILSLPL